MKKQDICKRCDGTGWITYEAPAKQLSIHYKDKDYRLRMAKKCPECTKAKKDVWEDDFTYQDLRWEDIGKCETV